MTTETECSHDPANNQRSVRFGDEAAMASEPMKLVVRNTFLEMEQDRSVQTTASTLDRRRAKSDTALIYKFDGTDWQDMEEAETEPGTEVATNGSPDSGLEQQRQTLRHAVGSDESSTVLLPDCCLLNDPDHLPEDADNREVVELSTSALDKSCSSRSWKVADEDVGYDLQQTKTTPSRASLNSYTRTPLRTPGVRTPGSRSRKRSDPFYKQSDGYPLGIPPWGQMPFPPPHSLSLASKLDADTHAAELEVQAAQLRLAAVHVEAAARQARQDKTPTEASPQHFPPMNPWMYSQMAFPQPPHAVVPPFVQAPGIWPPWPHYVPPAWPPVAAPKATPEPSPPKSEKKKQTPKHAGPKDEREFTTVMLKNLPNDYTRDMLLGMLDSQGFAGCYDFVYLPIDFKKQSGLGYAFLNLLTHDHAERLRTVLQGFQGWKVPTQKVMEVSWSQPLQGLNANIERYKNSPVMHQDVPEHFKPLLFKDGQRIRFPPPAKRIRPPVTH